MPNGGSDCCGTCWFNSKNKGEPGYGHTDDPGPSFCAIRNVDIPNPFYTYCANHPHRNPAKLAMPIGPAYTGDSLGNRKVWVPLEDTPENRVNHLELLRMLSEVMPEEYPIGKPSLAVIIEQLLEWKEFRAIPIIQRIAGLLIEQESPDGLAMPREVVIKAARRALEQFNKASS
jgi:hypothetical protein